MGVYFGTGMIVFSPDILVAVSVVSSALILGMTGTCDQQESALFKHLNMSSLPLETF